jgi:hypothetical protein
VYYAWKTGAKSGTSLLTPSNFSHALARAVFGAMAHVAGFIMKRSQLIAVSLALGSLGCGGGPQLPSAAEIESIEVVKDGKQIATFPKDRFPKVLALLQSASVDRKPKKWEVMGRDLKIRTMDGATINVWMFSTYEGSGAFAVGPTWENRTYYRGSTDAEMKGVLDEMQK